MTIWVRGNSSLSGKIISQTHLFVNVMIIVIVDNQTYIFSIVMLSILELRASFQHFNAFFVVVQLMQTNHHLKILLTIEKIVSCLWILFKLLIAKSYLPMFHHRTLEVHLQSFFEITTLIKAVRCIFIQIYLFEQDSCLFKTWKDILLAYLNKQVPLTILWKLILLHLIKNRLYLILSFICMQSLLSIFLLLNSSYFTTNIHHIQSSITLIS